MIDNTARALNAHSLACVRFAHVCMECVCVLFMCVCAHPALSSLQESSVLPTAHLQALSAT